MTFPYPDWVSTRNTPNGILY